VGDKFRPAITGVNLFFALIKPGWRGGNRTGEPANDSDGASGSGVPQVIARERGASETYVATSWRKSDGGRAKVPQEVRVAEHGKRA
jgi:hypothetical protein